MFCGFSKSFFVPFSKQFTQTSYSHTASMQGVSFTSRSNTGSSMFEPQCCSNHQRRYFWNSGYSPVSDSLQLIYNKKRNHRRSCLFPLWCEIAGWHTKLRCTSFLKISSWRRIKIWAHGGRSSLQNGTENDLKQKETISCQSFLILIIV